MIGVPILFMVFGGLIFLGFFASEIFEKTRISDSIILICLGIIFRVTGLINATSLDPFTGLVASLALAIILFESGMSINIKDMATKLSSSFNMANLSFLTNSLAIAGLTYFIMGWDPLTALLVGFLLGGTSAAVVIPIARKIFKDENSIVAELESTITNVYNVVFTMSVASLIRSAEINSGTALNELLSYLSIGTFIGIIFGLVWINIVKRLWTKSSSYMITLGMMLILFGFSEYVGGSGAVCSLVFGFIMGNTKEIAEILKTPVIGTSRFVKFSQELSFLIRTYFFLFLGVVLKIPADVKIWALAISIAIVVFILRSLATKLLKLPGKLAFLMSRGLSEAVLASLMITMNLPHANEIISIVGLVIIATNILPSLLFMTFKQRVKKMENSLKSA